MTKIIGLTGGIGSGKTTIAQYFKSLGVPVYIADDEAKKLLENPDIQNKIKAIFGKSVFQNNTISKEKLASIVFQNPQKLTVLNTIIHPAVNEVLTVDEHLRSAYCRNASGSGPAFCVRRVRKSRYGCSG
jgi:dephospho-CoA kinase